jgi:hypothetical protein
VPSLAAEDAVNQYLIEHHEVCLEEILSDAVDGRIQPPLAEVVQVTAACLDRSRDEDGALTELYEGVLTVQGVRYGWRAAFYTDLDGERFVADLVQFRPLDWRARVRLVQ